MLPFKRKKILGVKTATQDSTDLVGISLFNLPVHCTEKDFIPHIAVYGVMMEPRSIYLQIRSNNGDRFQYSEAKMSLEAAKTLIETLQAAVEHYED